MAQNLLPGSETLKLGPPAAGTVVISVDARRAPAPFTAAVQTLLAGAELPVHRMRDWDEIWVVLKGQGRVTLGDRASTTVVHGAVLSVPKQTWFGLRNTGNGPLQAVVVSAPAGVDGLFRELAQLGQAPDPSAVQQAAARYGVEFRPSGGTPAAQPAGGRSRHRRGRGGRGRRPSSPAASQQPQPAPQEPRAAPGGGASVQPAVLSASPPAKPARGEGRRRGRRGRGRGRGGGPRPPSAATPQGQPQIQKTPASPRQPSRPPGPGGPKKRDGRRHSRHVKEVYMGGKWVQVSGEGPVIAHGESAEERRVRHHQVDEEGPGGPLSVPL